MTPFFFRCSEPLSPESISRLTFSVTDVGQGLAQIGISNGRAVVWDLGPPEGYESWAVDYQRLGNPYIESIVLSHSDLDHRGGLKRLEKKIQWSGRLVTSCHEDTSLIRREAGEWAESIEFHLVSSGDTIGGLDGTQIECIWPPGEISDTLPLSSLGKNRYSLVFRISHGRNRILITSDIDTFAQRALSNNEGIKLNSSIFVVPHHGSGSSLFPTFTGLVRPSTAAISCSKNNTYGHPDRSVLILLAQMGVDVQLTSVTGSLSFESNGFYFSALVP